MVLFDIKLCKAMVVVFDGENAAFYEGHKKVRFVLDLLMMMMIMTGPDMMVTFAWQHHD